MELIRQAVIIEHGPDPEKAAKIIEAIGRTCYKSEDAITEDSANKFIAKIIKSGHESVIEHLGVTLRFITNRGVTHEMVRHRLAAYSQESTRYVNYDTRGMQFILPVWMDDSYLGTWTYGRVLDWKHRHKEPEEMGDYLFIAACMSDERYYKALIASGWLPQQAREVLGQALKTEICTTYNFRTWRHVLQQRTSKAAHPQIRALMKMAATQLRDYYAAFFNDLPSSCFNGD